MFSVHDLHAIFVLFDYDADTTYPSTLVALVPLRKE